VNFYVDFDDCLCETGRAFAGLASDLFGKNVPYEEMRYFNLREAFSLTEEQFGRLLAEGHEPDVLLSFEETPGASAVINEWIGGGHHVSVITGRPFSSYEPSRLWLDQHGLRDVRIYFLDKYGREIHRKENECCLDLDDFYRMKFDYAVEDSPLAFKHFERLPKTKVLVYDRPWNRGCEFPREGYTRCFDWKMIREIVG
jgi:hypothetical protein